MKRVAGSIAVFMLLMSASLCLAGAMKEPTYSSEKPLYAKVVLNEKATRVLTLAFDESRGTGKGYDTVYADLNFNGDLTDDNVVKGTREETGDIINCLSPAINLGVPYNEKGQGVDEPWEAAISYKQVGRGERAQRWFSFISKVRVRDESGVLWECFFRHSLHPVEKPVGVPAAAFAGKPVLILDVKRDEEKEGNVGIAADLWAEGIRFRCSKDNQPTTARVRIRNEEGKVVHSEDVSSDKLGFG